MSLLDDAQAELAALAVKNRALMQAYPGDRPARQPVHTFYEGAHLYRADSIARLGALARESMDTHAGDPLELGVATGLWSHEALGGFDAAALGEAYARDPEALRVRQPAAYRAARVYDRVREKLAREPIEDYRLDFEDGFGTRPDEEEAAVAVSAAEEVARAHAQAALPPFLGIRIKSFADDTKLRGARTLALFIDALLARTGGVLPCNFVVTLPKVNLAEQPALLVKLLAGLEARHALTPGSLKLEMMIETTQALIGFDGLCPLPGFLRACAGRCTGVHFGTYDYTASCGLTAAHQTMAHPLCDLAKGMMVLAFGGTGVFLSDGATNVLPVGPHASPSCAAERSANRAAVHHAWQLSQRHIRHSLAGGFYQGWDLHAAQLPVRFATCFAFFLDGFDRVAERLASFFEKRALTTAGADVFDDVATGQALLNHFLRALHSGAITASDAQRAGLTPQELSLRSFAKVLAARRPRDGGR